MEIVDDDRVSMTGEQFDARLTESYIVGQAGAWEDVAKWLLDKAAQAYVNNRDNEAAMLRDLAGEARETAEHNREAQRKHQQNTGLRVTV